MVLLSLYHTVASASENPAQAGFVFYQNSFIVLVSRANSSFVITAILRIKRFRSKARICKIRMSFSFSWSENLILNGIFSFVFVVRGIAQKISRVNFLTITTVRLLSLVC